MIIRAEASALSSRKQRFLRSEKSLVALAACVCLLLFVFLPPAFGEEPKTNPATSDQIKQQRKQAAERVRRIIYNNDGNDARWLPDEAHTLDNFLSKRVNGLEGSQVDSIFYCTGVFNLYTQPSKESETRVYREERALNRDWTQGRDGPDTLGSMIEFGHKHGIEVFWSMRMNDCHDSTDPNCMSQWKQDHLDWLVGKKGKKYTAGGRRWSALNYEVPGVREKVFNILADVAGRYDVDGLELDFFRSPTYFKPQIEGKPVTQAHCDMMTDLVRRVRRMADQEAVRRGRPMLIAVRVPDSVECARAIGLDIEQWLKEGLVDVMTVSCLFRLNPWETSVALGHKYGVPVYPSLSDSRFRDEEAKALRITPAGYRGRALEAWAAGADGIYMFNYDDPASDLWKELGDPRALLAREHIYTTGHTPVLSGDGVDRWLAGGLQFFNLPVPLPERPVTLVPGKLISVEMRTGIPPNQDPQKGPLMRITARFQFQKAPTSTPALEVKLNGNSLGSGTQNGQWLDYSVRSEWMKKGVNRFELLLPQDHKEQLILRELIIAVQPEKRP